MLVLPTIKERTQTRQNYYNVVSYPRNTNATSPCILVFFTSYPYHYNKQNVVNAKQALVSLWIMCENRRYLISEKEGERERERKEIKNDFISHHKCTNTTNKTVKQFVSCRNWTNYYVHYRLGESIAAVLHKVLFGSCRRYYDNVKK